MTKCDWPGCDVEHVVDPQHPLEVQAQAHSVIIRHEPLEAGEEVGGWDEEKRRMLRLS